MTVISPASAVAGSAFNLVVSDEANVGSWIASWIVVAVAYLYMLSLYPSVCSGIVVGRRLLSFGTCSPPSMNYRLKELSVSTAAGTVSVGVFLYQVLR